jgi:hypothetical protein
MAAERVAAAPRAPSVRAVLRCQIQEWYPTFARDTIKTEIIALPEAMVQFLLADGIRLPPELERTLPQPTAAFGDDGDGAFAAGDGDGSSIDEAKHPEEEEEEEEEAKQGGAGSDASSSASDNAAAPAFPRELVPLIEAAIARLGGAVFPKLNWSAPSDASWIACGETLRCSSAGEVVLLLKASDYVTNDLCHAFDECADVERPARAPAYFLALRRWSNLFPSREFRVFVVDGRVAAACQRHVAQFFPHLPAEVPRLRGLVAEFVAERVVPQFEEARFTLDVYADAAGRVWIVDFNPWGGPTDSLLFAWEELEALASGPQASEHERLDWPFRVVDELAGVSFRKSALHRLPVDVGELAASGALTDALERLTDGGAGGALKRAP